MVRPHTRSHEAYLTRRALLVVVTRSLASARGFTTILGSTIPRSEPLLSITRDAESARGRITLAFAIPRLRCLRGVVLRATLWLLRPVLVLTVRSSAVTRAARPVALMGLLALITSTRRRSTQTRDISEHRQHRSTPHPGGASYRPCSFVGPPNPWPEGGLQGELEKRRPSTRVDLTPTAHHSDHTHSHALRTPGPKAVYKVS